MARRALVAGARPEAVQAPAAPTVVSITVVDKGRQFGLRLDWTPATDTAGTVSYERAVRYYTSALLTTPASEWITLGSTSGAAANTDESGPYERPAVDQWVRGRVRAINSDGSTTDWVYSATAPKIDAGSAEAPVAPLGLAVTVLDRGYQFALKLQWTITSDTAGTVGYERAVRYFSDSGLLTATSEWITLGTTYGAATLSDESGPYPRAANDRWVKGRVRAINADGSASAWVESSGAKVASVVSQVTAFSAAITDYGMEHGTNRPMVAVTVSVTEHPVGADYFSVWIYEGASAPSDRSLYDHAADQPIAASGTSSVPIWRYRNPAATTLHILVTTSSYTHYAFPTSSSPYGSVVIPAITAAAQPTGFGVTVEGRDYSGVASGRYVFAFTPPSDPEYWTVNIYRRWCTAPGVPAVGAEWDLVESFPVPRAQPDFWLLPTNAEYWQFKIQSVTKGGLENTTSPPTINVTVPAASGVAEAVSVHEIPFASTITVDVNDGVRQFIHVAGNCYFNAPLNTASRTLRLTVIQNGSDGHQVTFASQWGLPDGFEVSPYANTYTSLDLWFNAAGRAFHASPPVTRMP